MEKLLHDILSKTKEEKRDNIILLIEIMAEVIKRCPYLAAAPRGEQREVLKILRERSLI